jgi:hypothetical protein
MTTPANKIKLDEFIKLNTESHNKQKVIELKIITYQNEVIDVFTKFDIDKRLFDFVISKKGSRKTVFAQNTDNSLLRSFDSTHEIDRLDINKFLTAFDELYKTEATSSTDDIRYSKVINTINDIESHMYT